MSNRDGTERIYLADADGSVVTSLTEGAAPTWSRDGRWIAFHRRFEVYIINVDGSGFRHLARGLRPAWSPDGGTLVFESWFGGTDSELDLISADGTNRRPLLTSGGLGSFFPEWSPDGQRILFSVGTYIDFETGLFTVGADGSDVRQIGDLWDGWDPAWSPDGSEIAFATWDGIATARADGSGRGLRVSGAALEPAWTPDGQLVFTRQTSSASGLDPRTPARIFIANGTVERQLIPDAEALVGKIYRDSQAAWLR